MRVVLDHNVPHRLRPLLVGHDVFTTRFLGWEALTNGLLQAAADAGFEALVTCDKTMVGQHHEPDLPLPVVVLMARTNAIVELRPFVPPLLDLLAEPLARQFHRLHTPNKAL